MVLCLYYGLLCIAKRPPSSFEIILAGNTELVALLCLSFWCLEIPMWLLLMVLQVGLQCACGNSWSYPFAFFHKRINDAKGQKN